MESNLPRQTVEVDVDVDVDVDGDAPTYFFFPPTAVRLVGLFHQTATATAIE